MPLLQDLLKDRSECILLFRNHALCSCGKIFGDYTEAENHLVQHSKGDQDSSSYGQIDGRVIREHLSQINKVLEESSQFSLSNLVVPANAFFIVLGESEIDAGTLDDFECPSCKLRLASFWQVEDHYKSCHVQDWLPEIFPGEKILVSKQEMTHRIEKGSLHHYFCPLPGCKYHLLNASSQTPKLTSLPTLKQLKQHYIKVHSSKPHPCTRCSNKFPTKQMLNRHNSICGLKFKCGGCPGEYGSLETLQTHCRRKRHSLGKEVLDRIASKKRDVRQKEENYGERRFGEIRIQTTLSAYSSSGLLKLAPKPSPMHLSAAIALSELSSMNKSQFAAVISRVEVGVQTDPPPTKKRSSATTMTQTMLKKSAETQTKLNKKRKVVSSVMTDIPLQSATAIMETKTSVGIGVEFDDFELVGSVLSKDRPLWAASSTQTSPTRHDVEEESPFRGNPDFLLLGSEKNRPPKLGEIEQLSTETQTDVGQHMMGSRAFSANVSQDWGDIEPATVFSLRQIEAETQFDLDDILCSNYTQTGSILESPLLSMASTHVASSISNVTSMNSIETQTMDSILDVDIRPGTVAHDEHPLTQQQQSVGLQTHMETQT